MTTPRFWLSRLGLAMALLLLTLSQPIQAALIPPFFLDCVVAVGRKELLPTPPAPPGTQPHPPSYGPWIPEASGFLYGTPFGQIGGKDAYRVYIVTNRHVIEDHDALTKGGSLWVRFNLSSPGAAREYGFALRDAEGKPLWHFHPNPAVDIAVLPLNNVSVLQSQGAKFSFFRSNAELLTRAKAKEIGLSEGDGVFVLGFPMGLVGQPGRPEDYVIVRQGAIARVRDALNSSEPSTFLVDSFIFPGNSGGPVVLRPELSSIQGTRPIAEAYLLGVVKGYIPYTDVAISLQTQRPRVTFEENSGLAEVIPAEYVQEVIADYEKTSPTPGH